MIIDDIMIVAICTYALNKVVLTKNIKCFLRNIWLHCCFRIHWSRIIFILTQFFSVPITAFLHDDVIKWKHFPRYWPFVRGIHRSPVKSSHKGQWRGALMFSLIYVWINGWVNSRGDLRRYRGHYDVIVMSVESKPCIVGSKRHVFRFSSCYWWAILVSAEFQATWVLWGLLNLYRSGCFS